MDAFIVRPFGKRKVLKKDEKGESSTVEFDFDFVQDKLITPALNQVGVIGGTTGKIFEAGSIHEDMFSLLLTADLVIADISIHNANVFYELGIRHALRDKRTILLKCSGFDETPFDIMGYRYIAYKKDEPAASIPDLVQALQETIGAERKDSPVFERLTKLESQDPERFIATPRDFEEEIRDTFAEKNIAKLSLMADEVSGFAWSIPGLRKIGEKLYALRCFQPARKAWEKVLEYKKDDLQANELLATIYQRLAESEVNSSKQESDKLFAQSDDAIESLLRNPSLTPYKKAEFYSLKARNAKAKWLESWRNLPENERQLAALTSDGLLGALANYEKGFLECLNHFYAGINALGLTITTISLAERFPDEWECMFSSENEAAQKLAELKQMLERLKQSVAYSIKAGKQTIDEKSADYGWLKVTEADFICLTETKPKRVKLKYQNALRGASGLNADATVRQLNIYEELGIVPENIKAALEALPTVLPAEAKIKRHTLLFTGHRIDTPATEEDAGRAEPRFPAEIEPEVRAAMKEMIQKEVENIGGPVIGLAGGASGGDILFHEVCAELGIDTKLYLALPRDQFVEASVAHAGSEWIDRFDDLYSKSSWCILSDSEKLPKWLSKKENYTIWQRNNNWMLNEALTEGGLHMTLIALWDGKGGDGPGGTAHMVKEAKARGAKTLRIKMSQFMAPASVAV